MRVCALTLLATTALAAVGCADGASVPVTAWTLTLEDPRVTAQLTLPTHLDTFLPARETSFTLETTVAVPPAWRGRTLALSIPCWSAVAELDVDGERVENVAHGAFNGYRETGGHRWIVPAHATTDGRLTLALHARHAWSESAWIETAPYLGLDPRGDARTRARVVLDQVDAGSALLLLVLAFVYGGMWLMDRKRRGHGWFALQALGGATYPLFLVGALPLVLGARDIAFVLSSMALANVASLYAMHYLFGIGRPPRILVGALIASSVVGVVASTPFQVARWAVPPFAAVNLVHVGYMVTLYGRLWRAKLPNSRLHLFAWVAILVTSWTDLAVHVGAGLDVAGLTLFPVGAAVAATLQIFALGREHTHALREVEARVESMQQLNEELKRQMADRSRQLSEALTHAAASAPPSRVLRVGDVLDARWRVVRPIGAGGMGAVYEVERDGKRYALKLIRGQASAPAMARFAREARVAAELDHPNLVSLIDIDVSSAGGLYLVMELVEGETLEAARGRFGDPGWALPILRQIAEGLQAMHAHGVVHRDLKPGNVLLTHDGQVKIVDFGLATLGAKPGDPGFDDTVDLLDATIASGGNLTRTGMLLGTPRYMAPELTAGAAEAGPSADVFSFGVIAYELLARASPFPEAPVLARLHGRPPPRPIPLERAPRPIPSVVAALVDRCLNAERTARPTAEELAARLAAVEVITN